MDFMKMRKGKMFYKKGTDFEERYVVVDYDEGFVYCVDLRDRNKLIRVLSKFSYNELDEYTFED